MRASQKMPNLKELRPFDSCLTLGRVVLSSCPQYLTAENVLETLDRYRIAEALVHANHARLVHHQRIPRRIDRSHQVEFPNRTLR